MRLLRGKIGSWTFLGLWLIFFFTFSGSVRAETYEPVRVYGRVIDAITGFPLPNTKIVFWDGQRMLITETDSSGFYSMKTAGEKFYQVYAYYSPSSNFSFEYIPAYDEVYVKGGAYNVSFMLYPGAAIKIKGKLRFFKTLEPPTMTSFKIVDKSGLHMNITCFGEDSIIGYLLRLRGKLLFVPSDIPIKVEVNIYYSGGANYHLLIDHEGEYFTLNRGDMITVDLEKLVLMIEVESCYDYMVSTQSSVYKAEGTGFYVSYERSNLLRAKNLLEDALSALSKEDYDEAYADLREAYFIIKGVESSLLALYQNASVSTFFITPLLCFTALAIAAFLSAKRRQRLAIGLLLYGLLLSLLYLLYPGYKIFGISQTMMLACLSIFVIYGVIYGLPYAFKEKPSDEGVAIISALTIAFSLSVRNLKRRKLQTSLALILLFISVFAFTTLTSFSWEYGFAIRYLRRSEFPEGFLVRKSLTSGVFPFSPIRSETYRWLQERSEVTVVAPKFENMPQETSLGFLSASKTRLVFPIWGIVGVAPSLEAKIIEMDNIIVQGRFLEDEDVKGILISEEAANYLGVEINDTLHLLDQDFILIGIFNSERFEKLKDINGNPMAPYAIVDIESPTALERTEVEPCKGFQTVIIHQRKAQSLPNIVLSRIFVQTRNVSETMRLARQAVLTWREVEVFASSDGHVYRLFIGPYYIAIGFIRAIIPLILASINIGVLMVNVIYERRREVMIMSSLGLNPFHITALFMIEALTIGIISGSLGYLLGISSYRFMTLLIPSPALKHKAEAIWGILAIFFSITAAMMGSMLPALKTSTIVTPSLARKWRIEHEPQDYKEPWMLSMPIRLRKKDLNDFFIFLEDHLERYKFGLIEAIENVNIVRDKGFNPTIRKLLFTYINYDRGVISENEIRFTESFIPNLYLIKLVSKPRRGSMPERELNVWITASLIRRLILLYVVKRKR